MVLQTNQTNSSNKSEANTINRQMEKYIESMEMWVLQRKMRIPWTTRKTNTKILLEANEQWHIISGSTT
jgi:hypothetical protein